MRTGVLTFWALSFRAFQPPRYPCDDKILMPHCPSKRVAQQLLLSARLVVGMDTTHARAVLRTCAPAVLPSVKALVLVRPFALHSCRLFRHAARLRR